MQLSASHWFGVWRERVVAFDPGLTNLLLATRAVTSVMLALGMLYALTQLTGQPPELPLVGGAMAMFSVLTVNDSTQREQKITALLLPLPAMLSMAAGALLSPWRFVGDGVFVVIIFAAVYVRRFGPRAFALGMLAFVAYFIGTLVKPALGALPWLFAAICVGVACSFLMRHVILPERPRRALKRMLRAVLALTGRTLDDVIRSLASGDVETLHHGLLRQRLERLNDAAISTESQVEKVLPDGDQPNPSRTRLALAVLDLELRAERVVVTALESTDPVARNRALYALRALRASIRQRSLDSTRELKFVRELEHTALERAVRNLASALSTLAAAQVNSLSLAQSQLEVPASGRIETSADRATVADVDADREDKSTGLSLQTRQAIQAAIAGALAIGAGELLSPHRWYWAAIAAFVVFTGTNSRGELLVKSWQRMAGTMLGVVAGVLIGTLVQGHMSIVVALIFINIFMGFYLLRVSYGLLIFCLTIVVALVYSLLGYFSWQLLLRLEETAIGVAAGIVVSVLLLPMTVRLRAANDSREFLRLLADTVVACGERLVGGHSGGRLTVKARALDRQFQQLRATTQPLTGGVAGGVFTQERAPLDTLHDGLSLLRRQPGTGDAAYARGRLRLAVEPRVGQGDSPCGRQYPCVGRFGCTSRCGGAGAGRQAD